MTAKSPKARKSGFARIDKHSFFLKIAALVAKSMCVIPILNFVLLIYLSNEQRAAGGNTISILYFFIVCLPAMVWGFFLYYFDALFGRNKKGKKKKTTFPKVAISVLLYIILGAANVGLLWFAYRNVVIMGAAFIGIFLFAYWGYSASVKSYSEVMSTTMVIVIACIYIFYLLTSAFMWIAASRTLVLNADPVVLGVVIFGALSFVVMNQASIDYEMQNQDAESTDARRNIQQFNFKISLILVAALSLLYFTRKLISDFLVWILKVLQGGVTAMVRAFNSIKTPEFDVEKDFSAVVDHEGEAQASSEILFDNPEAVFYVMLIIAIAMLIVFRKPILKALRKGVKFFAKMFQFKTYTARGTSQYYRDLVEEVDEAEAFRLFASSAKTKQKNKAMVKEYDKLKEPNERVRRALPIMRTLFATAQVEFADGDTVRDTTKKIDAESVPLREYSKVYEDVRYDGADATPAEGEAAAALVHGAYEQAKAASKKK